jgi:integrase
MPSLALPRRGAPAPPAGAPELAGDLLTASLPSPIVEAGGARYVPFRRVPHGPPAQPQHPGRLWARHRRLLSLVQRSSDRPALALVADRGCLFQRAGGAAQPRQHQPTSERHSAVARMVTRAGVLSANPAACVRGVRLSRAEGKTPVLEREQARRLFAFLNSTDVVGLRDRALLGIMLYDFVRVGAVIRMRGRDFQDHDDAATAWLVLSEKGGKQRRLPAHHLVREDVRAYLAAAGLRGREHAMEPLFQSAPRGARTRSGKPLDRSSVLAMVKRRCSAAGLSTTIRNHSFRATGITLHQENGGDIETAARLAGHVDTRTTQLYDRTPRHISSVDVERVHL